MYKTPSDCCFQTLFTCVIVIVDGHCGRVVVTEHGFGCGAGVQRGGADLRVADHTRVTQMHVEVLVLLEDVVVNHTHGDLWENKQPARSGPCRVDSAQLKCGLPAVLKMTT